VRNLAGGRRGDGQTRSKSVALHGGSQSRAGNSAAVVKAAGGNWSDAILRRAQIRDVARARYELAVRWQAGMTCCTPIAR
jgi:hypothetical protein